MVRNLVRRLSGTARRGRGLSATFRPDRSGDRRERKDIKAARAGKPGASVKTCRRAAAAVSPQAMQRRGLPLSMHSQGRGRVRSLPVLFRPVGFVDQPYAVLAGHVAADPLDRDEEFLFEIEWQGQMHEGPEIPCERSRQPPTPEVEDRDVASRSRSPVCRRRCCARRPDGLCGRRRPSPRPAGRGCCGGGPASCGLVRRRRRGTG